MRLKYFNCMLFSCYGWYRIPLRRRNAIPPMSPSIRSGELSRFPLHQSKYSSVPVCALSGINGCGSIGSVFVHDHHPMETADDMIAPVQYPVNRAEQNALESSNRAPRPTRHPGCRSVAPCSHSGPPVHIPRRERPPIRRKILSLKPGSFSETGKRDSIRRSDSNWGRGPTATRSL